MSTFQNYSAYYNLLYKDKNYRDEALYIHELIQTYNPGAKTILNLGCGTGKHDIALTELGYRIVAIDLSPTMIEIAQKENSHPHIEYFIGDVRSYRIDQKFDVVLSLFHVMSYQTTNKDLKDAFKTVKMHLANNGVFIFDCWFGPGVTNDPPKHVEKKVENDSLRIHRKTTPHPFPEKHIIDVQFDILVEDVDKQTTDNFQEVHSMRYWFNDEINEIAKSENLEFKDHFKWMTTEKPGFGDWYTVNILQ